MRKSDVLSIPAMSQLDETQGVNDESVATSKTTEGQNASPEDRWVSEIPQRQTNVYKGRFRVMKRFLELGRTRVGW